MRVNMIFKLISIRQGITPKGRDIGIGGAMWLVGYRSVWRETLMA